MMMNKKAATGETILTIYRIVIISFLALVILGVSAVFYDYYIDVRDTEAVILTRSVVNCLVVDGKLDLDMMRGSDGFNENKIFEYCGFDKSDGISDRLYARVVVRDDAGKEVGVLQGGDSGIGWVRDILNTGVVTKYRPGYLNRDNLFGVRVVDKGKEINGKLSLKVLVNHEF